MVRLLRHGIIINIAALAANGLINLANGNNPFAANWAIYWPYYIALELAALAASVAVALIASLVFWPYIGASKQERHILKISPTSGFLITIALGIWAATIFAYLAYSQIL